MILLNFEFEDNSAKTLWAEVRLDDTCKFGIRLSVDGLEDNSATTSGAEVCPDAIVLLSELWDNSAEVCPDDTSEFGLEDNSSKTLWAEVRPDDACKVGI